MQLRSFPFIQALCVWLCVSTGLLGAQDSVGSGTPPPTADAHQEGSIPTFHTSSRLVLVDVVATDKAGKFVPGLRASDLSVFEDGKPQRIAGFSEHVSQATASTLPLLQLPPHQYTNFSTLQPGRAVNIILLDLLNTQRMDQAYARKQMLRFLADLPPGQTVALFALNSRLTMVQGFTGNSEVLVGAAKSLLLENSTSHLLNTPEDRETAQMLNSAAFALNGAMNEEEDYQDEVRTQMLLQSLQVLARSVSGYSGRKNLLWLSSQFPFRLDPDFNEEGQSRYMRDHRSQILEIDALMLASQIAVYPIDVTGLKTNAKVSEEWAGREAMSDIARQTGGVASYNTNDLKYAMLRSIEEGTNYYTLAYAPTNANWNGRYRKIEVKTRQGHVELRFRRGYYAIREKGFTGDQAAKMLASAMQPTVPESTMLLLRVQVLPPGPENRLVRIDYAVEAQDIAFTDTPDKRKQAAIDFMATAWDKKNQDAAHVTDTMQAAIRRRSLIKS